MRSTLVKIRPKGQVTLPAEMLRELGWKEGEQFALVKRGKTLVFERPEDLVERGFGMLRHLADPLNQYRTAEEIIEEEDRLIERAVIEEYEAEMAEIQTHATDAVGVARD